ncbi:MAG: hypothetical protein JJ979_05795 [Roseibium sp.]|nr:hypothetical protein [Roseibium sp.]
MSFIFGGDTGLSYQELQRRRREVNSRRNRYSAPKDIGEGLTALGIALSNRLEQGRVNSAAKAGQERGNTAFSAFQSILSGGGDRPSVSGNVPADGFDDINSSLAHTESGGRYDIRNSEGYTGKYQFGQERLNDFNRANGSKYTTDDLLKSPELQETVQNWHIGDIDKYITDNELSGFVGQEIGGVKLTQNSLRAMAHLGGNAGMKRFLQSGGRYNPSDSNGTSLLDYARTHAGAGAGETEPVQVASADPQQAFSLSQPAGGDQPVATPPEAPQQLAQAAPPVTQPRTSGAQAQQPFAGLDPKVFELMASPDLSPGQRAVMTLMLQQHLKANQPVDPLKQLQIQKLQKDIDAPPDRDIVEGADGFKYYRDTGERVLPGVEKPEDPLKQLQIRKAEVEVGNLENPDRKVIEGADGFKYYQDTGERVLPNVEVPQEQYRTITGEEAAALGLDPSKGYNVAPDGKVSQIGGQGTNVTVNTGGDFKVPSGYMRDPNNPNKVVAIPGGPAQKLGSETAGRIGLAEDALEQLDEVSQFAAQGDLTGLGNFIMGSVLGRGEQGAKVRELKAASEAITRMLTGAGMNPSEAQREVELYLPKLTDDAETVVSKIGQLKRRLQSIIEVTDRGRGGPAKPEDDLSVDDLLKKYGGQ